MGKGFEEIRAVEEVGMVGRDTVVVRGSLPVHKKFLRLFEMA
jgi:hypothetical protein